MTQQQPGPATVQRSIAVLQAQRNQAMDAAANSEVRAIGLAEELAKAQARITELEEKKPAKK